MKPKPFRIFRVGTHTDSAGQATTFTREQLEATVKAYNEGDWRAPMVVGHPKGHAPAYGWVGKLSIDDAGEIKVDDLEKLNPDFAELMASGAYRNRSASWYAPDHPNNPTPGVWQLRHLGMLGAQPPALKGLGDIEFHDSDGVTVDFAEYSTSAIAGIFRRLRDTLIAKWGVEEVDKALPSYLVEDLEAEGRRQIEATSQIAPAYSEPTEETTMTPEEIAALQAQAAKATQLETDLAAANTARAAAEQQVTQFSESQKAAQKAVAIVEAKAALKPLVDAGKLLPAQLDQAANFMVGLDDETKSYDFGESTGETALTARGFFKAILDASPKQVDYEEQTGNVQLPANLKPEDLAQKARDYQDSMQGKGVTITSAQAVDAVLAGKTGA